MIADASQRELAIDVSGSCIVQAPAGSGKTELLIQRFLALLAQVERPNQILAITFTRKAAAEMRHRLLEALSAAKNTPCPEKEHEAKTWQLATAALEKQGENLLRNPAQLTIQTIDSFNTSLVRKMPWLSRFGSVPEVTEDAEALYRLAAEQLLQRLDIDCPERDALRRLLGHLDNQVGYLQTMLVDMLKKRDQWLRYLLSEEYDPRTALEAGINRLIADQLLRLRRLFPSELTAEFLFCAEYAAGQLNDVNLADLSQLPGTEKDDLENWQLIARFLLTAEGKLRKTVTVKNGFPSGKEYKDDKQRMLDLLSGLSAVPGLAEQLKQVWELPARAYTENQWQILQCLIELLPRLVAELWLVFRAQGKADFAAIALQAKAALGDAEDPTELLLQTDNDLRHILVDEFQDTSWLQYELLDLLTSGWIAGDGRTLFLVGDPMQSIYRFREAEVGLFLDTFKGRLGAAGPLLKPLQLTCNFRSQQGIVDWVNETFEQLFPAQVDIATGAVPLAKADAVHPLLEEAACTLFPFDGRDDQAEADQVLQLIQQARREDPQQKIAILVRGRNHLQSILPLLRQHGEKYQAQDIDQLGARPVVLDLLGLCKAVLQRADRLSWLSVLRAPWCGLSLNDLNALVEGAGYATIPGLLSNQQRLTNLSDDGQAAIARIWPVLQRAISRRGRLPLRALMEGTWLVLGGPACYAAESVQDAELFFGLLESLEQGGELESVDLLEEGLQKLFAAPDGEADGRLQVMTIHKAKGLQFDTVILPGLGKTTGRIESPLLRWQQHPRHGLLLAPVAARGSGEKDPTYQLIGSLENDKQELEAVRLLYVATTRAVSRLYLLGHAKRDKDDRLQPVRGSLLEKLWPVVGADFVANAISRKKEAPQFMPPLLRSLPADWRLPQLSGVTLVSGIQQKIASQKEDDDGRELVFSGWENESKRHVGTLVHQYLEQIARFGGESWRRRASEEKQRVISRQLSSLGVPNSELPVGIDTVSAAVEATLASERGQWILAAHPEHACELALTGVVDDELVHAVIDRTFVFAGERWIIDYKTSSPNTGETKAVFVRRQQKQYAGQMRMYSRLLRLQTTDLPIRTALYFPLLDGWCELNG